ncbi:holo-ACP synthase|uniref:Holo-[acyl-carrier-protein] synthase n=1 Tax=Dendrosporobacter quercicolus TaxID=146817 RepID=A0A1G9Y9Z8_9FIRM|nr:holo-ACP synthase [Dendrosporobacter quercicolus]NSL47573.1 holo-ACP synthase [Dendrosporobacter quercicolus DSM 1736]SDN05506.1 holo-[acyl-carrier protein] synthase [Dendrosporobacter quercicolus]
MIIGTGIDIIEIDRIARAIVRERFIERVFTAKEQSYCNSRGRQRAASYAARFAGKEAILKAFGTGLSGGELLDIEIIANAQGKPEAVLKGYYRDYAARLGVTGIYLSLTHARQYSAANAILWGERK